MHEQNMRAKVLHAEIDVITQEKGEKQGTTVFHELLESSLPTEEKTTTRLQHEAQAIIGAGTETTAWTLAVISFYLVHNRALLTELQDAIELGNPTSLEVLPWRMLEQIPYVTAIILEGLRLTYGVATRLARVAPDETLYFQTDSEVKFVIPPGSAIGMTSLMVHHNPDIFPDSKDFKPERWIDADGKVRIDLQKYLLSFSKGSRQCLGMK